MKIPEKLKRKIKNIYDLKKAARPNEPQEPIKRDITLLDFEKLNIVGYGHYLQSLKSWELILFTIPLDYIVFFLLVEFSNTIEINKKILELSQITNYLFYAFLALSFASLFRDKIIEALISAQGLQRKFQDKTSSYSKYLILIIPALLLIDLIVRFRKLAIIPFLFLVFHSFSERSKIMKKIKSHRSNKANSPIEIQFEKALFITQQTRIVTLSTLVIIRAASFCGVASLALNPDTKTLGFTVITMPILGFFLLLLAKPEKVEFVSNCKRCAAKTGRAFRDTYYCPKCATKNYKNRTKRQN